MSEKIFEINNNNYSSFLTASGELLLINGAFCTKHKLHEYDTLFIKNIDDKSVTLSLQDFALNIKINVHTCYLRDFYVGKIESGQLLIWGVTIGIATDDKHVAYRMIVEHSKFSELWVHYSIFNEGLLVRNKCEIKSFSINNTTVKHNYTFINSTAESLTIESSFVDKINIESTSILKKDAEEETIPCEAKAIYIFRSEITGIRINDCKFEKLDFHKIRLKKSEPLNDHFNQIYVTVLKDSPEVSEFKIAESSINESAVFVFNDVKNVNLYDNDFQFIRLHFHNIKKFNLDRSKVSKYIDWGHRGNIKIVEDFTIDDCVFERDFNLTHTVFKKQCRITGSSFLKYPAFFSDNIITPDCKTDFEFSNLTNFIFNNIDFKHFSFLNLDIPNAKFQECEWDLKKEVFYNRVVISEELQLNENIDLIKLKSIYSQFKDNFKKQSDYISYGKFYVSEQEIKRKIARTHKSWFEYSALTFHKFINSFGESFGQPLLILVCVILSLSFIYLFTGFTSNGEVVKYTLALDCKKEFISLSDWWSSFILSIKNVVPFPLTPKFFVSSDNYSNTQVIELFQKILSLVLAASFTTALLRYIKK